MLKLGDLIHMFSFRMNKKHDKIGIPRHLTYETLHIYCNLIKFTIPLSSYHHHRPFKSTDIDSSSVGEELVRHLHLWLNRSIWEWRLKHKLTTISRGSHSRSTGTNNLHASTNLLTMFFSCDGNEGCIVSK